MRNALPPLLTAVHYRVVTGLAAKTQRGSIAAEPSIRFSNSSGAGQSDRRSKGLALPQGGFGFVLSASDGDTQTSHVKSVHVVARISEANTCGVELLLSPSQGLSLRLTFAG